MPSVSSLTRNPSCAVGTSKTLTDNRPVPVKEPVVSPGAQPSRGGGDVFEFEMVGYSAAGSFLDLKPKTKEESLY